GRRWRSPRGRERAFGPREGLARRGAGAPGRVVGGRGAPPRVVRPPAAHGVRGTRAGGDAGRARSNGPEGDLRARRDGGAGRRHDDGRGAGAAGRV
ncbi:MAG: hypothetical protein AVDCRST_MAG08-442, partial [uncultured Acetobacteraceae bacterium]